MNLLLIFSALVVTISADADADALYYGAYGGAALGAYHAVAAAPIVAVHAVAAAPAVASAPILTKAAPIVTKVETAVPSVTSSQFHSQEEEKNYSFGYSNINSARVESGNAGTGVSGSYSDGFRTYHYVADGLGFRHV